MSDNFRYQLSVKIDGNHLLNVRSESAEEFFELLKGAVGQAELIISAARALEGRPAPPQTKPGFAPRPAQNAAPSAPSGEIGPIGIDGVSLKRGPKDGEPWRSPMYIVAFSDGSSASTFEELDGKAAQSLVGQKAYITLGPTKNPKYNNIAKGGVRSAAQ